MDQEQRAHEMAQRYWNAPEDLRWWAEAQGFKALEARAASGAAIAAQASTTLGWVLGAVGGAGALALPVLQGAAPAAAWGALAAAGYLAGVAVYLVVGAMAVQAAPPLYGSPDNLILDDRTLAEVRTGELARLQQRIEQQAALNDARARMLNRARLLAVLAPGVYGLAAAAARLAAGG